MQRKLAALNPIMLFLFLLFSISVCSAMQRVEGGRRVPPPTEKGSFVGTWYYVDRDQQFAIFLMKEGRKVKAKLRWEMKTGESFETDWDGECRYMYRGNEGIVHFDIANPGNKKRLDGKWLWQYKYGANERKEMATFNIYRAEEGLKLVWLMPDWQKVFREGDKEKKMKFQQMHILRKASERIINWEEIPF
ncbi:MAG: hypothetical protein AB1756_00755 [Acidobacteriota bacterium]